MNIREKLKLYFIMGSPNCLQDPVYTLKEAIHGGITLFQFREKGKSALVGEEKYQLAKILKEVCRSHNIPFIVNDDLDLALSVDADGIHIGQEDIAIQTVRKQMLRKIVGVSCHNVKEAKEATAKGADYIGVGPMFETNTKLDTRSIIGPSVISEMRNANLTIPIVGIGGITALNASKVIQGGADGVAVISAISQQPSPRDAAQKLIERLNLTAPL